MFIDKYYLLSEDENEPGDEPMEQDSNMGNGEQQDNPSSDEISTDDMGGEGSEGEDGEGMDDSSGGGESYDSSSYDTGEEAQVDPKEAPKKKILFENFKKILSLSDEIINSISYLNYNNMSNDVKKIFNYMENKITNNHKKIILIMTSQFNVMSYKQLMTLYLYCKMTIQTYVEIIDNYLIDDSKK